jgi:hypothetical protein
VWQLVDAAQRRQRRGHVAVGEVGVDRLAVDLARDLVVGQQRGHLGGEAEDAVAQAVEERLLADAIARDQALLPARVPEREREHPVQPLDAVDAVLLVEVRDDLGVAVCRQRVPARDELLAQLAVVVDLAVQDDRDGAVLVEDRLVAGGEVDHAQALDPQRDVGGAEDPARVRPAVLEARAHALGQLRVDVVPVRAQLSDDSAHPTIQRSGGRVSHARKRIGPDCVLWMTDAGAS